MWSNTWCSWNGLLDDLFDYSIFIWYFLKVQLEVECRFVQDQLKGDLSTELKVKFLKKLEDALPVGED